MKKAIFLLISLSGLSSCSDFLTTEPVEKISINEQLSTKKGVLESLNGAYYQLRTTYFSEGNFVYGDLLSGNLKFTPQNSGATTQDSSVSLIYNFEDQSTDSDLSYFYSNNYQIINNINLILQYTDDLQDATANEKSEIKAEALALRAFVHFQLYKYYAQNYTFTPDASHLGIAYITAPQKPGVDYPVRKTVSEVFVLLENDLQQSLSLFQPNQAIPAGQKKNFMNIDAAKLLRAEISLWKNDWQKAYDYANDLINTTSLILTPPTAVSTQWALSESVFEIANDANNEFPAGPIYNFVTSTSKSSYNASNDVYNLFSSNDNRKTLLETQNLKTGTATNSPKLPYHFTKKYKLETGSLIYRLSLAYFIRAEAALHLGNSQQALSDINIMRNRAGLSSISTINIDILLEEKRKEFVFENQYFFDLMRNHKNIIRNNGCISTNCSPIYPNDKFILPIPQSTININSAMQQNPGY
ncbi:RagB/SusD family nutrient uptake outer membrane protein [Chryseobacterium sp.]|uniref:RagB/SusD family nutrient uptake outer membrane protein n=1 Tax=Chryseobacterium sp. TaxID=1871047 RepID=UPI00289DE48F|nr:RagB/SusD family nutrient uptake outer membrane protein [Chryseobacterium sp.]